MTTTNTTNICLRVRKRRRKSDGSSEDTRPCWNLFARLAPQVALELYQDVLVSSATTRFTRRENQIDQVLQQKSRDDRFKYQYADINFLPLAVTLASGETVYTSYNGGDWRSSRSNVTTSSHHGEEDALGRSHYFFTRVLLCSTGYPHHLYEMRGSADHLGRNLSR